MQQPRESIPDQHRERERHHHTPAAGIAIALDERNFEQEVERHRQVQARAVHAQFRTQRNHDEERAPHAPDARARNLPQREERERERAKAEIRKVDVGKIKLRCESTKNRMQMTGDEKAERVARKHIGKAKPLLDKIAFGHHIVEHRGEDG